MTPALAIALILAAQQKRAEESGWLSAPLTISNLHGQCISGTFFDKERGECSITIQFSGNSSPVYCEPVKDAKDTFRCAYSR